MLSKLAMVKLILTRSENKIKFYNKHVCVCSCNIFLLVSLVLPITKTKNISENQMVFNIKFEMFINKN